MIYIVRLTSLVYEVTGSADNTGNGGGAEVGGGGGFLGDGRPVDHQSRVSRGIDFRIKIHFPLFIIHTDSDDDLFLFKS